MSAASAQPSAEAGVAEDAGTWSGHLPAMLPIERVRELTVVSNLRGALAVAFDYGLWLAVAWASERFWHPALYVVACAVIGARLLGLAMLAHDATHFLLFSNRKVNDLVGTALALPAFLWMPAFRQSHLAHHRFLFTEKDPNYGLFRQLPVRVPTLLKNIFVGEVTHMSRAQQVALAVLVAALAVLTWRDVYWARLLLLYWIVPGLTFGTALSCIRELGEHYHQPGAGTHPLSNARVILAGPLQRLMVAPHYIHLHGAHHVYPSIPFYRLRQAHRELMKNPEYASRIRIRTNYLQVIRECLGSPVR